MISSCLDIVGAQDGSQFLYLLTREAVDNTALVRVLLDKLDDILVYILCLRTYLVVEVWTIK